MSDGLTHADRHALVELAPVLRRSVTLEPNSLARLRLRQAVATVLVRLPFGVLVARTVEVSPRLGPVDVVVRAREALDWVDGIVDEPPLARDAEWRAGRPPDTGWTSVESVPDHVVRPLVRSGALALKEAAQREGVPGAQPRTEVADALLDAIVLTVADSRADADTDRRAAANVDADGHAIPSANVDRRTEPDMDRRADPDADRRINADRRADHNAGNSAEITLRALSALTRMGFLPRGGRIRVDVAGRWVRVVAEYGTVYLERPGSSLSLA